MPHPDDKHPELMLGCKVTKLGPDCLQFEFVMVGPVGCVKLPGLATANHTDGLWKTTCFEAFLGKPDGSYVEFNFAPSTGWASYRFDGYRSGMTPARDLPRPRMFLEKGERRIASIAIVELPGELSAFETIALSAVIEEIDGTKSYWALAHPPGKPDFHHPACFTLTLPPPEAP